MRSRHVLGRPTCAPQSPSMLPGPHTHGTLPAQHGPRSTDARPGPDFPASPTSRSRNVVSTVVKTDGRDPRTPQPQVICLGAPRDMIREEATVFVTGTDCPLYDNVRCSLI